MASRMRARDFFVVALLPLLAMIVVAGVAWLPALFVDLSTPPEIQLALLLISGVLALVLALAAVAVLLAWTGNVNHHDALGLPTGTVRAVIAVALLLIFGILIVYLYRDVGRAERHFNTGLTREDVLTLAKDTQLRFVSASVQSDGKWLAVTETPRDAASTDIAKQAATAVITLVVAVTSFYFGSGSARGGAAATARQLRLVKPTSPGDLARVANDWPKVAIELVAEPTVVLSGMVLAGDPTGQVTPGFATDGKFAYQPGSPGEVVVLRFRRGDDADLLTDVVFNRKP